MRTVKLVIAGDSGVGKTSLRSQYISGRFSTGYRATIGADFITKTVPHPSKPDESVTLQIWDTAGQERFSSLSTAFFRGADAALLMFDVNQPKTLDSLRKWWHEFQERAPVPDEYAEDYCCVVVGNKIDLIGHLADGGVAPVTEAEAISFLDDLIPPSGSPPGSPLTERYPYDRDDLPSIRHPSSDEDEPLEDSNGEEDTDSIPRTQSIEIVRAPSHHKRLSKSPSRSRSNFGGTMTTVNTTLSIYHTPSSSLFDTYDSAPSSPPIRTASPSPVRAPRRMKSTSTSSSAPTITPSLFTHGQLTAGNTPPTPTIPDPESMRPAMGLPPLPERRPKLFFTSAKTGQSVTDVFEYIAQRVVIRWEYEESTEARTMHMREGSHDTVRLDQQVRKKKAGSWGISGTCC